MRQDWTYEAISGTDWETIWFQGPRKCVPSLNNDMSKSAMLDLPSDSLDPVRMLGKALESVTAVKGKVG